jgi:hypothetical protein
MTQIFAAVAIVFCLIVPQGIAGQIGNTHYEMTIPSGSVVSLAMNPSPGQQTIAKLPSGDFAVDSFFDVFTELEFELPPGPFVVDSFFDITYQIDLGGGRFHVDSFFDVFVEVKLTPPPAAGGTIQTEMVALNLAGQADNKPVNYGTLPALGTTTIIDQGGEDFSVDSFFDVFTEITIDTGPLTPGAGPMQVPPFQGSNPVGPIYDIQKDQQLYGNLDQNDIPVNGQYMCGPTSAVNSFIYLQNKYPETFGTSLVPPGASAGQDLNNDGISGDAYDDMIAIAEILGNQSHMNTMTGSVAGSTGTFDDMFIYGKEKYIESVLPGITIYGAEMKSAWAWLGSPPRPADQIPPINKPSWVTDNILPTWQFLFNELSACEDVEILIVDSDWGHFLTATGLTWNDANGDSVIDPGEGAIIYYIDPATGLASSSPIFQNGPNQQLFVGYGIYENAQLVMTVKESAPEPATITFLALGGLALLRRKRRRV